MFSVKKLFHEGQPDKSDQFDASGVLARLIFFRLRFWPWPLRYMRFRSDKKADFFEI